MKSVLAGSVLAAVLGLTHMSAQAHAVIDPKDVTVDSYQKLTFRVTHGCDGSPTTAVIVRVPLALHGAKPMPKPGWTISTQIEPLSEPYQSHGRLIDREVRTITWQGGHLPSEYFDEFSIQIRTPAQAGEIAIPVTQLCEKGRLDWVETSTEQTPREALEAPAPVIRVHPATPDPAAPASPHHH
jgi:uncharacterized protein YcnI